MRYAAALLLTMASLAALVGCRTSVAPPGLATVIAPPHAWRNQGRWLSAEEGAAGKPGGNPLLAVTQASVTQEVDTRQPERLTFDHPPMVERGPIQVGSTQILRQGGRLSCSFKVFNRYSLGLQSRFMNDFAPATGVASIQHLRLTDGRDAAPNPSQGWQMAIQEISDFRAFSEFVVPLPPGIMPEHLRSLDLRLRFRYPYGVRPYRWPLAKLPAYVELPSGRVAMTDTPAGLRLEAELLSDCLLGFRALAPKGEYLYGPVSRDADNHAFMTLQDVHGSADGAILLFEATGFVERTYDCPFVFVSRSVDFDRIEPGLTHSAHGLDARLLGIAGSAKADAPGEIVSVACPGSGGPVPVLSAFDAEGHLLTVLHTRICQDRDVSLGGQIRSISYHYEYEVVGHVARFSLCQVVCLPASYVQARIKSAATGGGRGSAARD